MTQDKQQPQEAQAITIDTSGYNPAADPGNPAFDMATWQAAVDKAGGLEPMIEGLKAAFADPAERARAYMNLSMGQIEQLPQEERKLVWDEMARQLAEMPGFIAFMDSLATSQGRLEQLGESIVNAVEETRKTFEEILPAVFTAADNLNTLTARIGTALFDPPFSLDTLTSIGTTLANAGRNAKRALDELLEGDGVEDTLQIWDTLQPYMDAEYDENPDKYSKANFSDLIAAAARRARADGKQIPFLRAEQGQAEQLVMDLNLPTEETAKDESAPEPTRRKRTEAEAGGALMSIGQRLLVPSDREFQDAFVSKVNSEIGIFVIDTLTNIQLRNNGLELSFLDNGITDILDANERTGARPLQNADTGFLRAMAKGAYITRVRSDSMTTSFYLPAFCDELAIQGGTRTKGADRAEARKKEVLARIESMGNVWGKLPNSTQWWKVFSLIGYDPATEIVTVAMPYFNQLLAAIERKQQRQLEAGKKYYLGYCDLLHASAANERNQAAVELAARVLIGVQQRGGLPDKKLKQNQRKPIKSDDLCTWKISCAGLIADCPQMQEKLEAQNTTDGKNKAMQRAFTTMYKVLREKSDLFTYYNGVTITEVIPTSKTRSAEIIIKHHGLNPNYHKPTLIIDAEEPDTPPA